MRRLVMVVMLLFIVLVVHSDINLANIMIDGNKLKFIDFDGSYIMEDDEDYSEDILMDFLTITGFLPIDEQGYYMDVLLEKGYLHE